MNLSAIIHILFWFVCGVNGMKVAGHKIEEALRNSTIEYEMITFTSTPCLENADDLSRYAKEKGCDMVCGVGGGVIGDTVKLVAEKGDFPLIQIPTSSATCVASTPLSVMYNRDTHGHLGSLKMMKEASLVIVDEDIMIEQPPRLFWAGVMDTMAKMIEITHRLQKMDKNTTPIGFDMAYVISEEVYRFFIEKYDAISDAIAKKEITKDFQLAVFYAIAVTGVISGVSKGSNQCALGHRFYEEIRTYFYHEAKDFVHGELVAMRDMYASNSRPVQQLIAFEKVEIAAGETKVVEFTIDETMLRFWNNENRFVSEPGLFKLSTGYADHLIYTTDLELLGLRCI